MEPSIRRFPPRVTASQHREGTRLAGLEVGIGSSAARMVVADRLTVPREPVDWKGVLANAGTWLQLRTIASRVTAGAVTGKMFRKV